MPTRFAIGPSIGVARLGDSADGFYLAPDAIGALPIECDAHGNVSLGADLSPERVRAFKADGAVRRQGALFRVYRIDDGHPEGEELTLEHQEVASISWTVHLANKKAAWFNFAELQGNLLYGQDNSYANAAVPLRNANVSGTDDRRKLIVDPGPRTVEGSRQSASFDAGSVPPDYGHASFPPAPSVGDRIVTLGDLRTDDAGRLIVLGGFGRSGGDQPISSFAGADTWHDDVSDGPVRCRLTMADGTEHDLEAWCIVGSPKFAPELVNIVSLDDTMWDVAVRVPNETMANRWWMGSWVSMARKEVTVLLFDQGVGIPRTLDPTLYERIRAKLMGMVTLSSLTAQPTDGEIILAATELHRTGTGQSGRGKGFRNMKQFVDACTDGELRVLSNRGRYNYLAGTESYANESSSIGGTVIEWRFRHEGPVEMKDE